ncbi:MAG: hypothetical protein ACPHVZ_09205 [Psychrobacter sp.]
MDARLLIDKEKESKAIRLPGDIISWCSAKVLSQGLSLADKFDERHL